MKSLSLVLLLALLTVVLVAANCTSSKSEQSNSNSKLEETLANEMYVVSADTTQQRLQVRQRVVEYLKSTLPNQKVKGISLTPFQGNVYVVGVDSLSDKGRKTFDLIARFYVPDSGEGYWKIEYLSAKRSDALSGKVLQGEDQDYEPPDEP
jgi:ABC-type oligopeptide transport system substrate-binding subunit